MKIKYLVILIVLASTNLTAQSGHWEKLNPKDNPGPRSEHGMAQIGLKKVLLFGGSSGMTAKVLNDTWIFDLESNDWNKIDCKNPPSPRSGFGFCQISDKKVLLFGGADDSYLPTFNDIWIFDLDSLDWKEMKPKGWEDQYYPVLTYRMGIAELSNNIVIIHGGEIYDSTRPTQTYTNQTWYYHIDSNQWEDSYFFVPHERANNMMANIGNEIIINVDGYRFGLLDDIWAFINGKWQRQYILNNKIPAIGAGAFVGMEKGIAVLFGGLTENVDTEKTWYDSTWILNYNKMKWSKLELDTHPSDRLRVRMARIDTNKILLFGGESQTNKRPEDTWLFIMDSIPTSVNEIDFSVNFISPNPATDFIEISVGVGHAEPLQSEVRIYDVFGQSVSTPNPTPALPASREGVRIDVSGLVPGMYFVRIGDKVGKFVKY